MLGRLLEISVAAPQPLLALETYRALGFRELGVGDVWSHPYGVMSDGDLCIGLHAYEFDSPALTFVQSNLDRWVEAYRVQGIELAFEKLATDSFNEIGFVDPGGQMVAVLESRTFSPAPFDERGFSAFGELQALALPCRDAAASRAFWAGLGRAEDGRLAGSDVALALDDAKTLTCRYRGDPIAFAESALRGGVAGVTVAGDERSATFTPPGGPTFVVAGVLSH